MTTTLTETRHAEGFIVSEANGRLSRDQGTLVSGQKVAAGTVLGTILGTTATAAALRTNTGNPTFGTINVLPPAVEGEYTLTMETATTFVVSDPEGNELPHGSTGSAYAEGGLSFTLTAGGTPAAQGDAFTIIVSATSAGYAVYDPTANNGQEVATAIALNDTDATSAACHIGVLVRLAEINSSELVWGTNVTTVPQQTAALVQLYDQHIISRSGEGVATYS
jgi:hypothetical protein